MAQPNEVINLVIALIALPFLVAASSRRSFNRGRAAFVAAYGLLLVALVATIAEGFIARDALNLVEHLSYAISGVLFALSTYWLTDVARRAVKR